MLYIQYIFGFLTGAALFNYFPNVLPNLNIDNPISSVAVPITVPQPNSTIQIPPSSNIYIAVTVFSITIVGAFGTTLYFLYDLSDTPNVATQIVVNAIDLNTNENVARLSAILQEANTKLQDINELSLTAFNTANLIDNLNLDPVFDENMDSNLKLLNEVLRRASANNARIAKLIKPSSDATNMFRGTE